MRERKLLSQAGLVCILCFFLLGMARGQESAKGFECEVWFGEMAGRTLLFGVAATPEDSDFFPFPPYGPVGIVYFLGRYDSDLAVDDLVENYFTLANDVRYLGEAQSATWTLVSTQNTSMQFRLSEGSVLPEGAVLKFDGKPLAFDTSVDVKAGERYQITYQVREDVALQPEQPDSIAWSMARIPGYSICESILADAAVIGTPSGYDADGKEVQKDYGTVSVAGGEMTYTLPGSLDPQVASVRFSYVRRTGGMDSTPATVVIRMTEGIAFRCLSDKTLSLEAGNAEEGKDSGMVTFEVVVPHGYAVSGPLSMVLRLPAWISPDAVPFPYAAEVKLYTDRTFMTPVGEALVNATSYQTPFELPVTGGETLYVGVTLKAGNKAESNYVFLDAVIGDEKQVVQGAYVYIKGTATLDLDGNGDIDTFDAIMFYNFVSKNGVRFPHFFNGEAGIGKLTVGIQVDPANADRCRNLLQSLPLYLDYDGDGSITSFDAIMFYNFVSKNGVRFPHFFNGEAGIGKLTVGIQVDSKHAAIARDKFQQLVK